jgi:hypothetical protein
LATARTSRAGRRRRLFIIASLSIALERPRHGVEQILIAKRLRQEVNGARLHVALTDIGISPLPVMKISPGNLTSTTKQQGTGSRHALQQFRRGCNLLDLLVD